MSKINDDCMVARDAIVRVHIELEKRLGTPSTDFWLGIAKSHASALNTHLHGIANALHQIEKKK